MPGALKGRALRDFIGVTGMKIRRARNGALAPLPPRLTAVLERLGVPLDEAPKTGISKMAEPSAKDKPR